MNKLFTVLIDLDSTVYDLLTPTLAWVRATYNITLKPSDIKEWEWGSKLGINLYDFWAQEGVFLNLKPFPHVKASIQKVHDWGVRQVFFSTLVDGPYVAWDKLCAIDRDFPFIGKRGVLLTGGHKDIARGELLVDDGPHNIAAFKAVGGKTVLARLQDTKYNLSCPTDYCMMDWKQYPEIILKEIKSGRN